MAEFPDPVHGTDSEEVYQGPRTPIERELAAIFEELLDMERVSVHQTFFDLNGFSLLATQLAARVRDTFGCELALRELFEAPTIEGLALLILKAQVENAGSADLDALLAEIE